jgi:hypothetical protein
LYGYDPLSGVWSKGSLDILYIHDEFCHDFVHGVAQVIDIFMDDEEI